MTKPKPSFTPKKPTTVPVTPGSGGSYIRDEKTGKPVPAPPAAPAKKTPTKPAPKGDEK